MKFLAEGIAKFDQCFFVFPHLTGQVGGFQCCLKIVNVIIFLFDNILKYFIFIYLFIFNINIIEE